MNTIQYYNENADNFIDGTINADVKVLTDRFLRYIPTGGRILDLGCGSGRDTKYFVDRGYNVTAIDGSEELCKRASEYSGIKVKCMGFFDINEVSEYDGIWACASLLHVEKERLPELITRLVKALRKDGVFYMSFKYGDFDGDRDGRFFLDLNEESFAQLLGNLSGFERVEEWISEDVRRGKSVKWLNEIIRRKE